MDRFDILMDRFCLASFIPYCFFSSSFSSFFHWYWFASHNEVDGSRKNLSFFCWILITNWWFEFDRILFLLDTFYTELEALAGWPSDRTGGRLTGRVVGWPDGWADRMADRQTGQAHYGIYLKKSRHYNVFSCHTQSDGPRWLKFGM
jgi:hypothetical protein